MITPVMATQAVEEQGNFTPLPFVVFGGDVHRSNAQGPNSAKVSFTDDFLRAVRLWQTAAEVPPQPPMHPNDDLPGDNEHDQNFETEFDNLDVLQDFPGEQEWIFFRPDPNNLGRAETLQLRVTAATTMRDIEIYLAAAWPDLLPGRPDWEVQMAVQYAFDDLHAPLAPGQTAFIIKAQADLNQGIAQRSVILLSMRTWILTTGWAASSPIRAFLMDTQTDVEEFFHSTSWCAHISHRGS